MERFVYYISRNVSGSQGKGWTEIVVAATLADADKVIQAKYPNHLIYLEGYTKA